MVRAISALSLLQLLGTATLAVAWQDYCESFRPEGLPNATVWATEYFAANDFVNITNDAANITTNTLPAFCRVQMTVNTNCTAGSFAETEVWLPDAWNGRFLALGNGGFGGGAVVSDLGFIAMPQGFAAISTDTGHNGTQGDGSFAANNSDNAIVDWGWRALEMSIPAGKLVTEMYYGQAANYSYYLGCSNGGRQGLISAQRFPEDFDGIVIGSPAQAMSNLSAWQIHIDLNVLPADGPQFITNETWSGLIHDEVLNQCDMTDGVMDEIVGNPLACRFRPETLACRPGQNTSTCLNLAQIHAIHKVFSKWVDVNQTFVFDGYYPGGELNFALSDGLVLSAPFDIAAGYFEFMVVNQTFDPTTLDFETALLANAVNPGDSDATSPNLTAFAGPGHNGKLLHYVGWGDQVISPGNSLRYYETVHAFTQSETNMDIDDFYRFFTVPGMGHCKSGFAPNGFGGAEQAAAGSPPLSNDPQHNVLQAMVAWVEQGITPENLTGAHYTNNSVANGLQFTRPLCMYPTTLTFVDGDVDDASSFACV